MSVKAQLPKNQEKLKGKKIENKCYQDSRHAGAELTEEEKEQKGKFDTEKGGKVPVKRVRSVTSITCRVVVGKLKREKQV